MILSTNPVRQIMAWGIEMLDTLFVQNWATTRLVIAVGMLIVLVYWTIRRVSGSGEDPTLRFSKSSETGSASMLLSGTDAVAVVAGGIGLLLFDKLSRAPLVGVVLIAIVAVHWVLEKRERASNPVMLEDDDD